MHLTHKHTFVRHQYSPPSTHCGSLTTHLHPYHHLSLLTPPLPPLLRPLPPLPPPPLPPLLSPLPPHISPPLPPLPPHIPSSTSSTPLYRLIIPFPLLSPHCVPTGAPTACRNSFIRTEAGWVGSKRTGRMAALISGEAPAPPKPGCLVCGKAQLQLTANTHNMTLQQLLDKVRGRGGEPWSLVFFVGDHGGTMPAESAKSLLACM